MLYVTKKKYIEVMMEMSGLIKRYYSSSREGINVCLKIQNQNFFICPANGETFESQQPKDNNITMNNENNENNQYNKKVRNRIDLSMHNIVQIHDISFVTSIEHVTELVTELLHYKSN